MDPSHSDDRPPRLRRRTDIARARSIQLAPDLIACRAYELFVERGREDGRDIDDWLRAERELRMKDGKTSGA